MLRADEVDIGAGQATTRGPRVTPARVRHKARIGAACRVDAARSLAVFGQMLTPARGQKRVEVARRSQVGVYVAVDDAQARLGVTRWGAGAIKITFEHQAHLGVSLSRGYVAIGLSISILARNGAERPSGTARSPSNCQCG